MPSRVAMEPRSLDASRRLAPPRAPVAKPVPLSWGATIPAGAGRARNTRGAMENRQGGLRPPHRKPPLHAAFGCASSWRSHGPAEPCQPGHADKFIEKQMDIQVSPNE